MLTLQHFFCGLSPRDRWQFVATRVRCGLHEDPQFVVDQLYAMGAWLCQSGEMSPWDVARRTTEVLLDSAADTALPPHWRDHCRSSAGVALRVMQRLAALPDLPPHIACEYRRQQRYCIARLESVSIGKAA